jgi:hypothetical protein
VDGGGTLAAIDEGDLAEVITWSQDLKLLDVFLFIEDAHLTGTFGDDEHLVGVIKLLHDNILRFSELCFEFGDHDRHDIFDINVDAHVILQNLLLFEENRVEAAVFLNIDTENQDGNFFLETRRNHFQKLLQLFLLLFCALSKDQENTNLLLELVWQVELLHGCIGNIDLFLEQCLLSATHLGEYSHISE